ncbi:MAG: hypothetical protein GY953_38600, partial [bacterium]|nr:hypothetical protein [bacterium]
MKPEQAEKLLGGYATGSLTDEERQALYSAALSDQKLFDALADEEALREALADETYRRELINALSETKPSLAESVAAWWRRPASLAWAGGFASLLVAAVIVYQITVPRVAEQQVAMVSKEKAPPAASYEVGQSLEPDSEAPEPLSAPVSSDERLEARKSTAAAPVSIRKRSQPSQTRTGADTPAEAEAKSEEAMLDVVGQAAAPPPALAESEPAKPRAF